MWRKWILFFIPYTNLNCNLIADLIVRGIATPKKIKKHSRILSWYRMSQRETAIMNLN
jgi:hypothetical protein